MLSGGLSSTADAGLQGVLAPNSPTPAANIGRSRDRSTASRVARLAAQRRILGPFPPVESQRGTISNGLASIRSSPWSLPSGPTGMDNLEIEPARSSGMATPSLVVNLLFTGLRKALPGNLALRWPTTTAVRPPARVSPRRKTCATVRQAWSDHRTPCHSFHWTLLDTAPQVRSSSRSGRARTNPEHTLGERHQLTRRVARRPDRLHHSLSALSAPRHRYNGLPDLDGLHFDTVDRFESPPDVRHALPAAHPTNLDPLCHSSCLARFMSYRAKPASGRTR